MVMRLQYAVLLQGPCGLPFIRGLRVQRHKSLMAALQLHYGKIVHLVKFEI